MPPFLIKFLAEYFIGEIFTILLSLFFKLMGDVVSLIYTLLAATLLSGLCWWLCSRFSRLWNTRYRITIKHHILCLIAAFLTFAFSLTFASLKYSEEVARSTISSWQSEIKQDKSWEENTFRKAYEAVKALNVEDFSKVKHPDEGGSSIPVTKEESMIAFSKVYANQAVKHFDDTNPYLSKVIWAQAEIPTKVISEDVKKFMSEGVFSKTYSTNKAINLAAEYIKQGLDEQTPRIVYELRILLVILFILVQAFPFGWIAYAAYKDLKVTV